MTIKYQDFKNGAKVRFKKDYFDRASFAIEEPDIPSLASENDTGTITKASTNLTTITLDKGGFVRLFKSVGGTIEPWEKDDVLEIL